jgi:hypothetical protein
VTNKARWIFYFPAIVLSALTTNPKTEFALIEGIAARTSESASRAARIETLFAIKNAITTPCFEIYESYDNEWRRWHVFVFDTSIKKLKFSPLLHALKKRPAVFKFKESSGIRENFK